MPEKKPDGRKNLSPEEQDKRRSRLLLAAAAKLKKQILRARKDPAAFIEFVMRTQKGERLKLEPFHREWLDLFSKHNRVQIEAAKSHGKCLTGRQRVQLADGRTLPAEELAAFHHALVVTYNEESDSWGTERARVTDNGCQPIVRLVMEDGREIERTAEEPVLTSVGWKRIAEVTAGEHLAAARWLPEPVTAEPLPKEEAILLGFMIGCGTCKGSIGFTKLDRGIVAEFSRCAATLGLFLQPRSQPGNYRLSSRVHGTGTRWLAGHKLYGCRSRDKRIPTAIYKASNDIVATFISAYWACDGYINMQADQVGISSVCKELLEGTQTLLLRFGITARLSRRTIIYKGGPYKYWQLLASGDEARTWQSLLQRHWYREAREKWLPDRRTGRSGSSMVPTGWLRPIADKFPKFRSWLLKNNPYDNERSSRKRALAMSAKLSELGAHTEAARLKRLISTGNIWWNAVISVEALPAEQTYAISIENNPVYVCENLIAHNTSVAVGFILFKLGTEPNIRIKLFTQSDEKARERLTLISDMILSNKLVKLVFPNLRPAPKGRWDKSALIIEREIASKDPSLEASGVMGSVEGGRADLVVLDDISDFRTALIYPQHRETIKKKIYAEIMPLLDPDGVAISIATPHHFADVVSSLRVNPEWHSYVYAVGNDEDPFLPLWPSRWSRDALVRLRNEVGPMEYDRAYRCKAISSSLSIVKPEHIKYYDAELLGDPRKLYCVQSYDLAITDKRQSSYFACVTLLFDRERNLIFVVDAWRARLGFTEQAQAIIAEGRKWRPDMITIEETGYQQALREYLLEHCDVLLPIFPVKPGNKSKELRLMETLPAFEAGRIYFHPDLDPMANPDVSVRGDIVSQLIAFNQSPDKDIGDAFAYAVRALRSLRDMDEEDEWTDGTGITSRMSILG